MPSDPTTPRRGFHGLRVLVDGEFRTDPHGRGLSTYSRTLGQALIAIGCEVSWLSGAKVGSEESVGGEAGDGVLDEVMAFDKPAPLRGPRLMAQTVGRMAAGVMTGVATARKLRTGATVVAQPVPEPVYVAPEVFVRAHYRHMLMRDFVEVRVPGAKVDLLHLTAPLPIEMKNVKTVVTVHDLVPMRLPYTTTDNKAEFVARVRRAVKQADLVVTVSEHSKHDIVEVLQVDPAKVAVTYQCAEIAPLGPEEIMSVPRVLGRFGLKEQAYALFVGALEPKKNLRRMIEAFVETDGDMPLVLAGQKAWMWESELGWMGDALGEKARKRLRFVGYVDREDLRRLYAGAQFFLFPSLYEGFGLPVLEAMTMGTPVVTSSASSLPEIGGDAALYANPMDRDDIRKKVDTLMNDPALRAGFVAKARAQAAKFSLEAYTRRLAEAYQRLGV